MAITQLHPGAITGKRYGSFQKNNPLATHPVGRITQLHGGAITGGRYGSFAGKSGGTQILRPVVWPRDEQKDDRRQPAYRVHAKGIPSEEAFGLAKIRAYMHGIGAASQEAFGQARLLAALKASSIPAATDIGKARLTTRLKAKGIDDGPTL